MQKFFGVVRDGAGNAVASVTVQVNNPGTTTPATIYSTNTGTVLGNPFTNNADGSYQFYAPNGRYDISLTKTGFTIPAAEETDNVLFDDSTVLNLAALTSNTNNYSPPNAFTGAVWFISSTGAVNLTGIAAPPTAAAPGYGLLLFNTGTQTITMTNNDSNSTAGNRILTKTAASVSITANSSVYLMYDAVNLAWRQIS